MRQIVQKDSVLMTYFNQLQIMSYFTFEPAFVDAMNH